MDSRYPNNHRHCRVQALASCSPVDSRHIPYLGHLQCCQLDPVFSYLAPSLDCPTIREGGSACCPCNRHRTIRFRIGRIGLSNQNETDDRTIESTRTQVSRAAAHLVRPLVTLQSPSPNPLLPPTPPPAPRPVPSPGARLGRRSGTGTRRSRSFARSGRSAPLRSWTPRAAPAWRGGKNRPGRAS